MTPFSPLLPLDSLINAVIAVTFVLACLAAWRPARWGGHSPRGASILWAVGLGVWLIFPIANQLFDYLHADDQRRSELALWPTNSLSWLCILGGILLILRRSSPLSQAGQDEA